MAVLVAFFSNFYGLVTFFLLLAASSAAPIPGTSVLISSYSSLATTTSGLIFIWLFVAIACFSGDIAVYGISRKFSDSANSFLEKAKWYRENEGRVRKSLSRHEFLFIFASRFLIAGVDPVVNYFAGLEKLNFKKFFFAAALGEIVYSTMFVLIGHIFEDTWPDLVNTISYVLIIITIAIAVGYIIYFSVAFARKKKNR